MNLSLIVPVYNEELTIAKLLKKLYSVDFKDVNVVEVIVVNDCSTDHTKVAIENFIDENPGHKALKFVSHSINQGKGAAIRTGILHATGDYTIIQDADLELDPGEINNLLMPVFRVNADVVYGSRFAGGKNPRSILSYWHSKANHFLTGFSNLLSIMNITDMETCYKLVRTDVLKQIVIKENRFGFEPEITAKLGKMRHLIIYEVGISYYARKSMEGKKIGWKDGVRAMWCIVKYNLLD